MESDGRRGQCEAAAGACASGQPSQLPCPAERSRRDTVVAQRSSRRLLAHPTSHARTLASSCSSICAPARMVTRVQNMFSTHATPSPPAQSRCCCCPQINHGARILPAVPGRVARRPTSQQLPIIYEWKRVCTFLYPQPLSKVLEVTSSNL